jgi:DNA-binding NarL/FixJ family response regulator
MAKVMHRSTRQVAFEVVPHVVFQIVSPREEAGMNARDKLTNQERTVLALVVQGWRTAKIAQELFISPRTVETHLRHIFEKLGVSSRVEAIIHTLQTNSAVGVEIRVNPEDRRDNNSYA